MEGVSNVSNQQQYKSHSGLKIGTGIATLVGLGTLSSISDINRRKSIGLERVTYALGTDHGTMTAYRSLGIIDGKTFKIGMDELTGIAASETDKILKDSAAKKLKELKRFGVVAPIYVGAGALTDYLNNRQRKNTEPNAKTKKGNEYTKVNMGKKAGFILGAGAFAIANAVNKVPPLNPRMAGFEKVVGMVTYGLMGFAIGALSDKMSNRKARKLADKAAEV